MLKIYWHHNEGASEIVFVNNASGERYEANMYGFSERTYCCGNFIAGKNVCTCGKPLSNGSNTRLFKDGEALVLNSGKDVFTSIVLASLIDGQKEKLGAFWTYFYENELAFECLTQEFPEGQQLYAMLEEFNGQLEEALIDA